MSGEKFIIRAVDGPLKGDRIVEGMAWPLPDYLAVPEGLTGHYHKISESQAKQGGSHFVRGAQYTYCTGQKP